MSEAGHREPQLPGGDPAPPGLEPALAGRIPLRPPDVLARMYSPHMVGQLRKDDWHKPLVDWWRESVQADLMGLLIPVGMSESPARRKAVRVTTRFLRCSPHLLADTEARPRAAVEALERWACAESDVTWKGLEAAQSRVVEAVNERRAAVNAALTAGARGGPVIHDPMLRLAAAAMNACTLPLEADPYDACACVFAVLNSLGGSEWSGGPGDPESREARAGILARCADIIREEYPDIGAVLTELQAERR